MPISQTAVRRPIATVMFFVAVVLLGIISLQQLAVDLLPDISYPRLLVRTALGDAAPEEVVAFVTRPVEQALGGVSGIKRIISRSREGLSLVTLEFYWGRNMDYAALSVREKLDDIRTLLPERAERPQVLRLDPSARPIMEVAAGGVETGRLTELSRQIIRRRLEQLPGVALVEIAGGVERHIEVQVDPQQLLTQNITIEQISAALRNNNLSASGGTVKRGRYRFAIRLEGEFESPEDIRQTAVTNTIAKQPVLLGDIARIHYLPEDPESLTRLGGQAVVGLLITKAAGTNTVQVSREIRRVLAEICSEIPEITFEIVAQQADFIEDSIANVFSTLIWGGALALLALVFFLGNLRHPLNIGISMPVSIIATFVALRAAEVSLNLVSLGGLALGIGMLVDNSIVVLENIFRLREDGQDWVNASVNGAAEVAMPVTASTLTTCAVFLPVIYVEGITGQLFRDQSLAVVFSLLASLVVALTLLPVLASRFRGRPQIVAGVFGAENPLPKTPKKGIFQRIKNIVVFPVIFLITGAVETGRSVAGLYLRLSAPLFRWFERGLNVLYRAYHRGLLLALDSKAAVLSASLIVLLATVLLALNLNRELLPQLYPNELRLNIELPADATLYQVSDVVAAIEEQLLADPAVAQVFSQTGSPQTLFATADVGGVNRATLIIRRNVSGSVPADAFAEYLRRNLPQQYRYIAVFENSDATYREMLGLEASDLQIDVSGEFFPAILPVAEQFREQLAAQPGFADVRLSRQDGAWQYIISVDRSRAALYGVDTRQIAEALQTKVSGIVATQIKSGDRNLDVTVRPGLAQRDSWADIYNTMLNIPLNSSEGGNMALPLRELIRHRKVQAVDELLRQDQETLIRIDAAISGISRNEAIARVQQLIGDFRQRLDAEQVSGVRLGIGGQQADIRAATTGIAYALLLSIALVYMILAAQFESLRYPLLIMLAVPFGMIGAVWLLAITGNSLNIISGIGFVVLTGIVVNDAIIKVDFINQARRNGLPLRDAILDAGAKRFRPILITTITTVLGLLPMVLVGGSGAELRASLAIAVIGGLSLATVLTLILIPVVYEAISRK